MGRQQPFESIAPVTIRHLDDIREEDPSPARASRRTIAAVALLGAGCLTAIGLMLRPAQDAPSTGPKQDLLGDLVAGKHLSQPSLELASTGLAPPSLPAPSLAPPLLPAPPAAQPPAAQAPPAALPWQQPEGPPPLPFTPAPINTDVLPRADQAPPFVLQPPPAALPQPEQLGAEPGAQPASEEPLPPQHRAVTYTGEPAPPGQPGGYQLQVSSLRSRSVAQTFADTLRHKGHRAYVQSVIVKGKGRWHRVRIGPFPDRHAAARYQRRIETEEGMSTYIARSAQPTLAVTPAEEITTADPDEDQAPASR